jgi:hypothetical protein
MRRAAVRLGATLAGPSAAMEKVARLKRRAPMRLADIARRVTPERAPRRSNRNTETDACIGQLLERLEPSDELLPKGATHYGGRNVEVTNQDLAMKPLRSQRAEKRASQHVFVGRWLAAQDFGQRRRSRVELDGDNEAASHVNAVRSSSILDELQGACGLPSMKSTKKITETGRAEPAGKKHGCPRLSRRRRRLGQFPTDPAALGIRGRRKGSRRDAERATTSASQCVVTGSRVVANSKFTVSTVLHEL